MNIDLSTLTGQMVVQPILTGWVSYTPTGNFSANATYSGRWRRIGDTLEVRARISFSGAPNTTDCTVTLPTGLTINTSALPFGVDALGLASHRDASASANYGTGFVTYNSSTSVAVLLPTTTGNGQISPITQAVPFTIASGDQINLYFSVPITGWETYAAYGAGLVTGLTPGLIKAQTPEVNIAANISSGQSGFAVSSAIGIATQDNNGNWRVDIFLAVTFTSAAIALLSIAISGTVFSAVQAINATPGGPVAAFKAYTQAGNGNIAIECVSTTMANAQFKISARVASKPSWA